VNNSTSDKLQGLGDASSKQPERQFQLRRLIVIILLGVFLIGLCGWMAQGLLNPLGNGKKELIPVKTSSAAAVTAVVITATPLPVVGRVGAGLDCVAVTDILSSNVFIPAHGKVIVSGFTFARGGLVEISGAGWFEQGYVRCNGDLRNVERPYLPTFTPTVRVGSTQVVGVSTATSVIRYVQKESTPYPTYTPYPTSIANFAMSGVFNGVWFDSNNCLHLAIYGVREIYINGAPAVGGTVVCDVREFRVVAQ
jgi:hypothetical protein